MAKPPPVPALQHNNHLLFSINRKTTSISSFSSPHLKKSLLSFSSSSSSSSSPSSSSSLSLLSSQQQCYQLTRVSTAPVEYATPAPDSDDFQSEIARLKALRSKLAASRDVKEKESVIDADSRVKRFFHENRGLARVLASVSLNTNELFLVKCLVAAGQEHAVSLEYGGEEVEEVRSAGRSVKVALYALAEMIERLDVSNGGGANLEGEGNGVVLSDEEVGGLRRFLKFLEDIEQFYDCIGGIIGYQIMVLELLAESRSMSQITFRSQLVNESMDCQYLEIHPPNVLDLTQNTEYASQAALWGIEGLPDLGEIYPLGGAADRLGLVDPRSGECLPAAMLPFCGRTLLEGLIRDVQAREFLYFKLYGKQCITPVAIMTSSAKNNHEHVTSLCERLGWFGRGRSSFFLFEQPLVPTVCAEDGQWIVSKAFEPVCKPGGHGVIWKLAYDKGVFQWFYDHGRKGATVRQVSNVVAATDLTLLALAGIGLQHKKKLGFASCKRNSGATEGINVLIEKKTLDGKWAYGISCIEYTEFDKYGIPSAPLSSNSLQAEFPANTNIMYVDLPSAELVGSSNSAKSLPNMVLNTRKSIEYVDQYGDWHSVLGGRLECTMQNIADNFYNMFSSRCCHKVEDKLDTFIVYNERKRVTSSAKKKRKHSSVSIHQTPDGALLDILRNAYDILSQCGIKLPKIEGNDKYIDSGPPYFILLHPALGPLWEVTRQKFNGGSISNGSELQLEVAEFSWSNVEIDGSLVITAENVMGSTSINKNGEPILQHGQRCARCKLRNVKVLNKGINWSCKDNAYWKHDVQRFESCKVVLHGNAEFEANNVTLQGNHVFEVPDGYKMKITSGNPGLAVNLEPIKQEFMDTGTWYWKYKINGTHIQLELVEL